LLDRPAPRWRCNTQPRRSRSPGTPRREDSSLDDQASAGTTASSRRRRRARCRTCEGHCSSVSDCGGPSRSSSRPRKATGRLPVNPLCFTHPDIAVPALIEPHAQSNRPAASSVATRRITQRPQVHLATSASKYHVSTVQQLRGPYLRAGLDANVVHVGRRLARRSASPQRATSASSARTKEFGDVDSVVQLTARDLRRRCVGDDCNNVTSSSSASSRRRAPRRRARRAAPRPRRAPRSRSRLAAARCARRSLWSGSVASSISRWSHDRGSEESQHRRRRDVIGVQEELVQSRTATVIEASSQRARFRPRTCQKLLSVARKSNGVVTPSGVVTGGLTYEFGADRDVAPLVGPAECSVQS